MITTQLVHSKFMHGIVVDITIRTKVMIDIIIDGYHLIMLYIVMVIWGNTSFVAIYRGWYLRALAAPLSDIC